MTIHLVNSFDSIKTIPETDALNTLRIPISFVRHSDIKEAKPNNPKLAIKMASNENVVNVFPVSHSL